MRNYLSPLAESREIAPKGFGSFAVSPIPIGTIVAAFGGTTLNRINFETYPLEQRSRSIQIDVNQFVLGPELRESGDSINHSCLPNCGMRNATQLIAMGPIAVGEELTYDYAMSDTSDYDEFECACGSDRCRRQITGDDWKLPELQSRYQNMFSPYVQRKIDAARAARLLSKRDAEKSNAILLCHAWTGDSHATGPAEDGHPTPGWWEGMIGPDQHIDTNKWFVVCSNVIGGCQGSTGPASPHPVDGKPYGSRFPVITVRDMVRAQLRLTDMLGIVQWHSIVGGSMGGMQVLEWAVTFPDRVKTIIPIATCTHSTAQQIAWGAIGRRSIRLDPRWNNGEYYNAAIGEGPWEGLSIARMVSQVTFRSDNVFSDRFGRDLADMDADYNGLGLWDRFEVESYLDHHGDRLIRRFDTNSYLIIGKAMDLHDVARGRGGLNKAMSRIKANTLVLGISSDILYPTYQQKQIRDVLVAQGTEAEYVEIDSPHGHDAFLINLDQVGPPVKKFLEGNFA